MRFIRARRGSVAIEFALGLPIFLFLVYGIFEFGRVFWTKNTMEFAVEAQKLVSISLEGSVG